MLIVKDLQVANFRNHKVYMIKKKLHKLLFFKTNL